MKKEGRPWTEICEAAKCGNSIAARNRYQVLIGQQGGGAVVWEAEDTASLKKMLEDGEKAKWNYIANELSRVRNKKATPLACQKKIKELFDHNPAFFGIILNSPMHPPPYGPPYSTPSSAIPGGIPGPPHSVSLNLPAPAPSDFQDILQTGGGGQFMGAPVMIPEYAMRK